MVEVASVAVMVVVDTVAVNGYNGFGNDGSSLEVAEAMVVWQLQQSNLQSLDITKGGNFGSKFSASMVAEANNLPNHGKTRWL